MGNQSLQSNTSTKFNTLNGGSMVPLPAAKLDQSRTSPRKKSMKSMHVGGANVSEKAMSQSKT